MILIIGNIGKTRELLIEGIQKSNRKLRIFTENEVEQQTSNPSVKDIRTGNLSVLEDVASLCDHVHTVIYLSDISVADKNRASKKSIQSLINVLNEAKKSRVKHFIFVSSCAALYHNPNEYSMSVRVKERIVTDSNLPCSIVRPTLVYGENGSRDFQIFMHWLKRTPIVPLLKNGNTFIRPVSEDNLVMNLLFLVLKNGGTGKIFNCSGSATITIKNFVKFCFKKYGIPKKNFINLPVWLIELTIFLNEIFFRREILNRDLLQTLLVDCIPESSFEE